MAVGAVTFFNDRQVKRWYVKERQNAIVNRLNKTREERQVDYEAERQERERALGRKKKEFANAQVRARRSLRKKKSSRPSDGTRPRRRRATIPIVRPLATHAVYSEEAIAEQHRMDERRARVKAAQGGDESESDAAVSDDSFM